jgi:Dolichyl-phosphate-mannose-protein mannosyltransferase
MSTSQPASRKLLIGVVCAGMALRLLLACISDGSNDVAAFREYGTRVAAGGILYAYRTSFLLNHPPMMAWWAWIALEIGSDRWFSFWNKIPEMLADGCSCLLLWKIWQRRQEPRRAKQAAIAMALSPLAILISAYHCNIDNVYAFFSLLGIYFIAEKRWFFWAGLALGAAVNVKLIPVLLIPAALTYCRSRREALLLVSALALWTIPFLYLLPIYGVIREKVINYIPEPERWGVEMILHEASLVPQFSDVASVLIDKYQVVGRVVILLGVGAISLMQWRRPRWSPYELGFLCLAFFLIVTPGFGVQYLVGVLPLMLAVTISRGWVYSALGGIYLLIAYLMTLSSNHIPFSSYFPGPVIPMPAPLFGFLAWWVLTETAAKLAVRRVPAKP